MSKAEEKAQEAYPLMADDDKEGLEALKYIGIECECASVFNEVQKTKQAYFIEGYRQAEKDLIENKHEKSWRLDKQLWSGFKDIEEASYQYIYDASNDWAYEIPTWDDVQDAFKAGAEWKEDLELTLKDIEIIIGIENNILHECSYNSQLVIKVYPKGEDYYGEILKRYLKEREEK